MFRPRAKALSLCQRIADYGSSSLEQGDVSVANAAAVARTMRARELRGEATTIRQLHKVTSLTQMQALKALDDLETTGLVEIDRDLHDVFESRLSLSLEMRVALDKVEERKAG